MFHTGGGSFGSEKKPGVMELDAMKDGITDTELDLIVSRLRKVNAYIWCNKNQLRQYFDYFDDLGCNIDLLTWHKSNPVPRCSNKYLSDTEYLVFAREKGVPLGGTYATLRKFWVTPLNTADKRRYGHPTVKPLDITRTIIANSSRPGDFVIDPFLGSGTTAEACILEGRRGWGCEVVREYYDTAVGRAMQ